MPKTSCLIGILLKDGREETAISYQLDGRGVVIGSLLLVPEGIRSLSLKEEMRQCGLRVATLHPQFSPDEMEYLRSLAFGGVRKRVEDILKALDECRMLKDAQCKRLLDEVGWIKETLASYWANEMCDEVKRVNDLADVLISRLIELSKPQVLEVVKIAD